MPLSPLVVRGLAAGRGMVAMTGSLLRSTVCVIVAWMLGLWAVPAPRASAQIHSIKLFDAVPVTTSGPIVHASEAVAFGETKLVLLCPAVPSAIISSDPFGTAPVVVDNYLMVNGRNVCVAPITANSCFQAFTGSSWDASR